MRVASQVVKFAAFTSLEKPTAEIFDNIILVNDVEHEKLREFVNRWKETGEFLEKLRRDEIRKSVLSDSIKAFDGAFKSAIYLNQPKPTSGFVEFYKFLKKSK